MNKDVFFVAFICMAFILGLGWWLLESHPDLVMSDPNVPIQITLADGQFKPDLIKVPSGKSITLQFAREDDDEEASSVSFPQFGFLYQLPLNQKVEVVLPPMREGKVVFNTRSNKREGNIIIS